MELDHIDPTTKVDHRIWNWSKERQAVEVAKCQVLCYACHKDKTIQERLLTEHGNNMYTSPVHRCRCDVCKADHARVNAQYR